jgi:hypothetical protein
MMRSIAPSDVSRPVDQPSIIISYTCQARISSYASCTRTKKVRKGAKSVKPAHLYAMSACDEDAEHTIRRAMNRRPTLDHNMVNVAGKHSHLRLFDAHTKGAKRCKRSETSPSQLDAGVG